MKNFLLTSPQIFPWALVLHVRKVDQYRQMENLLKAFRSMVATTTVIYLGEIGVNAIALELALVRVEVFDHDFGPGSNTICDHIRHYLSQAICTLIILAKQFVRSRCSLKKLRRRCPKAEKYQSSGTSDNFEGYEPRRHATSDGKK